MAIDRRSENCGNWFDTWLTSFGTLKVFALVFCLPLAASAQARGNGWSSGGGDGVVCFASEEIKNESFQSNGQLKSSALRNIESISSLDLYEFGGTYPPAMPTSVYFSKPSLVARTRTIQPSTIHLLNDDLYELLSFPVDYLGHLSPVLRSTILSVRNALPFKQWEFSRTRLPDIADTGRSAELDPRCGLVQLALREVQVMNGRPNIKLKLDLPLWLLMSPLDKLALVLHEELYIVAALLGHADSRSTRQLVAYLLAEEFASQARWNRVNMSAAVMPIAPMRTEFLNRLRSIGLSQYVQVLFSFHQGRSGDQHMNASLARLRTHIEQAEVNWPGNEDDQIYSRISFLNQNLSDEDAYTYYLTSAYLKPRSMGGLLGSRGIFTREGGNAASVGSLNEFLQSGNEHVLFETGFGCEDLPIDLDPSHRPFSLFGNRLTRELTRLAERAQRHCQQLNQRGAQ